MNIVLLIFILFSFQSYAKTDTTISLITQVEELQKNMPMKVDDASTLIGVSTADNTVFYEMRLDNIDLSVLDLAVNTFKDFMTKDLTAYTCAANVDMDAFIKNKVLIVYKFSDSHNQYITDTTIRPWECGKA